MLPVLHTPELKGNIILTSKGFLEVELVMKLFDYYHSILSSLCGPSFSCYPVMSLGFVYMLFCCPKVLLDNIRPTTTSFNSNIHIEACTVGLI